MVAPAATTPHPATIKVSGSVALLQAAALADWGIGFASLHRLTSSRFVKRQKNDVADAQAICEAAPRPTMRFVASRMGERTSRRLLIIGASAAVRWARRKGSSKPGLMNMLSRKPPMLVIVALANRMARILWALMARGGMYRAPAVVSG